MRIDPLPDALLFRFLIERRIVGHPEARPNRPLWNGTYWDIGALPAYYAASSIRDAMAVPRLGYRGRISTLNRTGWYSAGVFASHLACGMEPVAEPASDSEAT